MNKIREMQVILDIKSEILNSISYMISNCEWALEDGNEQQKEEASYKINILNEIGKKIIEK